MTPEKEAEPTPGQRTNNPRTMGRDRYERGPLALVTSEPASAVIPLLSYAFFE